MYESRQNFKLQQNEKFISSQLLTNIIKSTDIPKAVVEEPTSELWYETLNGQGKITFKNNVTYQGYLKYGILNNDDPENPCTINFPDGTTYIGTIIDNEITGEGTYTFEDGSTYKGEVLNGLRNGKGSYKSLDGISYDGEWKNGLKHGKGKIIQGNMELEGEWIEGVLNGKCRIKWKSGNIFDGQLLNNSMNGNGYMIWYNKNEKYTGMWKNNLQNGYGIHIWYDAKNENKYFRDRYVGEWKDGKREGYGKFYYSNGNIYEGQWKNNQKEGFGIFYYHDRTKYIGSFKKDNLINSINLKPGKESDDSSKTKTLNLKEKKIRINKNIDEIKIPISINDIINTEPDSKKSLKEIDNLILRNLSIISHLYMYGCGKEEIKTMDIGMSTLGGVTTLNETKSLMKQLSHKIQKTGTESNNNLNKIDSQNIQNEKKTVEFKVDYDNVYNNDLYFCLDFNHFWKLIREIGLITPGFSLAMLDRVCFQNPDNIIDMLYIPESLSCKNKIKEEKEGIYDYIYKRIEKFKYDFENKYKTQIIQSQNLVNGNNNNNKKVDNKEKEEKNNKENKIDYNNVFNYHEEKNIILLRFFYEIIIRLAYIKYNDDPEMPLVTRVKSLLDEFKTFLRTKIKTGIWDSPLLTTMINIDPKLKNVENTLEKYISDNYNILNKIFIDLYEYSCYNENSYKPYDMTLTYRFFYDNIIANSEPISKIFKNKIEYIDLISIYIKDKKINSYNIDTTSQAYDPYELMEYIDILLDTEMIFREFCELIFFISRKYFVFYNINKEEEEQQNIANINKSRISIKNDESKRKSKKKMNTKKNTIKIDNKKNEQDDKGKEKENKDINNYKIVINYIIQEKDKLLMVNKYTGVNDYTYPVLKTHQTIAKIIENEKQRKIEEERKEKERQRYTNERNLLKEEDLNVYKEEEEQENTSESFEDEF